METSRLQGNKDQISRLIAQHRNSVEWLSELEFISDEQRFLEYLLSSHFAALTTSKFYDRAQVFINRLHQKKVEGKTLIENIKEHEKRLSKLMKDAKQENIERYNIEHEQIENRMIDTEKNYRYIKKKIFTIIEEIRVGQKQKKLIENT